jgi:hypothetical protein
VAATAWICAGLLLFVGAARTHARVVDGENIAPLTPYTITPLPNYPLAKGIPQQILTNGRHASGRFWTSADSIGWSWQSPIIYRQQFAQPQAIRQVLIGTGQNLRADIGLPSNVYIYASGQDRGWNYLGDAGYAGARDDGVQTLSLDFGPIEATAITIVIFRSSPYVFLDEVSILAASAAQAIAPGGDVGDVVADAVSRRRAFAERRAGVGPIGGDSAGRFAWPLGSTDRSGPGCQVTQIAPWTESDPERIGRAGPLDGKSVNAVGGWLYGAVRIENFAREPFRASLTHTVAIAASPAEVLVAHYVLGLDYRWRADVLVPSAGTVELPARSMTLVILRAHVTAPGDVKVATRLDCDGSRQDIVLAASAVSISADDRLHGNTWSYLLGPMRHVERCRSTILDDAWIDTAVVDSSALEPQGGPETQGQLRSYLRAFSTSPRLLLFMDLTEPTWTRDNGSELEAQLRSWWAGVSHIINEQAYGGEVLFYPIDEPSPDRIERLNAAAHALRRIAPSVRIFATIDNLAAALGADVEVKQFQDHILEGVTTERVLGRSPEVYAAENYTKTLSLSGYYRRLAWLAFGTGLHGVGIWSMWDGSGADRPSVGWTDFGGPERDFNLSYADASGCPLASRRLLAFQRGLEDAAVMSACQLNAMTYQARAEALIAARSNQRTGLSGSGERPAPDFDAILARICAHCGVSAPLHSRP